MPNLRTNRSETRQRQDDALALRRQGLSLRTIADQLGYGQGTGAVSRAIATATRRAEAAGLRAGGTGRRFGVEVEFNGVTKEVVAAAIRRAGFEAASEDYSHRTRTYWKVINDGSCGYEAVSPILQGEAGLTELRAVMAAMRSAGAQITQACGLHVHHDTAGMSGDEIARFVSFYVERQATMDRMVSRSRRGVSRPQFIMPWGEYELASVLEGFRVNRQAPAHINRYKTINVASFPKYGTIEFRQHQGTLSGRKAVAWVRLGWAMADAVQRNTDNQIGHGLSMLGDLADHSSLRHEDVAFLASRMEALA